MWGSGLESRQLHHVATHATDCGSRVSRPVHPLTVTPGTLPDSELILAASARGETLTAVMKRPYPSMIGSVLLVVLAVGLVAGMAVGLLFQARPGFFVALACLLAIVVVNLNFAERS